MNKARLKSRDIISVVLADLLATSLCYIGAYHIRASEAMRELFSDLVYLPSIKGFSEYYWLLLLILPLWLFFFSVFGLYDTSLSYSFRRTFFKIFKAVFSGFLIIAIVAWFFDKESFARGIMLIFFVLDLIVLSVIRLIILQVKKALLIKEYKNRKIIIVGTSPYARKLLEHIDKDCPYALNVVGFIKLKDEDPYLHGIDCLGDIDDIESIIEKNDIMEIFFAVPQENLKGLQDVIWKCESMGIKVNIIIDFFDPRISRPEVEFFEGEPLITLSPVPKNAFQLMLKRTLDIAASLFFITVFSPVFILTGILIKLTSKGPVFFKQVRSGLNGRLFNVYKFRSMYADAEKRLSELKHLNEQKGPVFKIKKDPRITPVGRFIRKFSIDELPQFFNVLGGTMSLVGPRPPIPAEVINYERWQKRRLSMKPGITCLWQISGRNQIQFDDWMKLDMKYIDNWSLGLDIVILFKTVPAVLFARGAN